MKKITFNEDEKEYIIHSNTVEKISIRKIAEEFGVDRSVIQTRLMEWGYYDSTRMNNPDSKLQFDDIKQKTIITLYEEEGLSMEDIAKVFGVSIGVIKRNLSVWGIDTSRKKYTLNEEFFKKIDTEWKAYWLGFISADGWVGVYGNTYRFGIEIKNIDIAHLQKFLDDINSNHKIYTRSRGTGMVYITIYSEKLVTDLIALGIVQNKSKILKPCRNIPLHLIKHHWRGLIDGDGWVSRQKRNDLPIIGLCGTYEICNGFKNYCSPFVDSKSNLLKKGDNNHYQYKLSGKYALPIIRELYSDATIYLGRKYQTAMEILAQYG